MSWVDNRADNSPYYKARRALARHMHRHHAGATGSGTLQERLTAHDDLHWQCAQRGTPPVHTHSEGDDSETLEQLAHRYLKEGEAAHGQANPTESS